MGTFVGFVIAAVLLLSFMTPAPAALEAKTGKQVWETKITDYTDGYFVSQAPLVVKGKVIVGIAGPGEMGPRGFVEAFDADTGKSQWRWYSVPAAGEPGSETWSADTWKIGGGAVWHTGTYDPGTNLLYVGTGNPAPSERGVCLIHQALDTVGTGL
jgi:alcohol dehydrogenase (cytochrome c)